MAFGRKKKGAGADAPDESGESQSVSSTPTQPQKKRRKDELLSSVIKESAPGAAIDLLKQNDPYALPNGNSWVGLLLSADSIGGLGLKQRNDATKGSIIELITADKIQVVATKAMLDEEFLGIVPNAETLDRMSEYSLLTGAEYYWGVFRATDGGTALEVDAVQVETDEGTAATYALATEVSAGTKSLADVLPEVWAWAGGSVEVPATVAQAPAVSVAAPALVGALPGGIGGGSGYDEDPLGGVIDEGTGVDYAGLADENDGVDYSELAEEGDGEPAFDAVRFEDEFDDDEDGDTSPTAGWDSDEADAWGSSDDAAVEDASAGYLKYIEENRDRVVDEQEVRDTIARRFLSDDLDLVVDLAEFDQVFASHAEAISIEVAEDPSDWLGSQVAQFVRQANAELAHLHRSNVDNLREMFVETMALHVERTMEKVSTDRPGSQYYELMAGAKKDFEALRSGAPQELSAQRKEITAQFEAAAESRASQAAAHARALYQDKNRPKLERDLAEVGQDLDRRHEEQYNHDRQTVLELRRKDANVFMDIGTNRVFEYLHEQRVAQREDERALLERWNAKLTQFIDENRKDDVARAQALSEQLVRENKTETAEKEHRAHVKALKAEWSAREAELNAQLATNRQDAITLLNARQAEWQTSLSLEQERARSANNLVESLTQQMNAIGETTREQYEGRIKTLEADKTAYSLDLERANTIQKRANSTMVLLVVTLTIAALAVGAILGWAWSNAQAPDGLALLGTYLNGQPGLL